MLQYQQNSIMARFGLSKIEKVNLYELTENSTDNVFYRQMLVNLVLSFLSAG